MDTLTILKYLLSIPSWVDAGINEIEIGNWIMNFLKKNSNLTIAKQYILGGRYNILAQNSKTIDILIIGHMDTVKPCLGWSKKPTYPEIIGNKIYGLGSSDMKSGLAIMLSLASNSDLQNNVGFLFYCDEEYDFLGMKKFIGKFQKKIKPKLIISLDGEGMQIGSSCRGLIEIKVKVEGKAGHAANPKSGINAITETFKVINKLNRWLENYNSKCLGNSTLNIAYVRGGGNDGNIIAEKCEYIVEIRVANEKLNAAKVQKFILNESEKAGLKIKEIKVRHDLGIWITKKQDLTKYFKYFLNKGVKNGKKSGFIDIQMLWKAFNHLPTFSFGVGQKGMSHKADEYALIDNILEAKECFEKLLIK